MKNKQIKLISYIGMIALLASLVISLLGFSRSTAEVERVKNQLLTSHLENNIDLILKYVKGTYGTLSQGNGTLLDESGKSIEGRFEVVDSISEDLGDRATIFVKVNDDFKRISTNVMNDDTRAVGTYLGKGHNAYETLMKGELFIGEATILGENYHAAYEPLKDQNQNVIGVLFVGVPTKDLDNIISIHDTEMSAINVLIIALRTISLGALIALASLSQVAPSFPAGKAKASTEP